MREHRGAARELPTMRLLAAAAIVSFLCGCHSGRRPVNKPQPAAELPRALTTKGIDIRWRQKTRAGEIRRVLDLQALTGNLENATESGRMNGASGTLYKDDRPRATFTAPIVEAARDRKTVTVLGGVNLKSIDPVGMSVAADKATWYPNKNTIVLHGGVRFSRTQPGATAPDFWGGPFSQVTVNTELERVHIP